MNFRGVGESVKANVVLTCVELTGLLIIIVIGLWAIGAGEGDVSRIAEFRTAPDRGAFWAALGGTTALLLLCVFTVVNIAVLVLRKDKVDHEHFHTPTFLPVVGAIACAFFAGPWTRRDPVHT